MVRSNGARIVVCGLHNDDQLLEIEVLHRYPAPLGLVSATEEEEEATMDTSDLRNVAALAVQGSRNLPSKTSRKIADHNEKERTAFTISAADSMEATDSGEQAVGMHSQNIE